MGNPNQMQDESLDDYINRMVDEEAEDNNRHERYVLSREEMAQKKYVAWTKLVGKPLGRKKRNKRRKLFAEQGIMSGNGHYY